MAEELHYQPWHSLPGTQGPHPNQKYPWNDWFNGKTWLLIKGEDFDSETHVFRRYIYDVSIREGVRVKTTLDKHGNIYLRKTGARRKKKMSYEEAVELAERRMALKKQRKMEGESDGDEREERDED